MDVIIIIRTAVFIVACMFINSIIFEAVRIGWAKRINMRYFKNMGKLQVLGKCGLSMKDSGDLHDAIEESLDSRLAHHSNKMSAVRIFCIRSWIIIIEIVALIFIIRVITIAALNS